MVSVLINNFNYERYVTDAIQSVFAQTYPFVEVIVVDDGSTDASLATLSSFRDSIQLIAKQNGGQASAFNAGFSASNGEFICFLDADDLFDREKVAKVVSIFEGNVDIGWCFDTPVWIDGTNGRPLRHPIAFEQGRLDLRSTLKDGRAPHIPTTTSGLSFRRELLEKILPMPEMIRITSDNFIKLAATACSPGWIDHGALTLQRIHENNAYTNRGSGKERLVGRTDLLSGIFLAEHFRDLRRIAFKMFCRGFAWLWLTGGLGSELYPLVKAHFRSMRIAERAEAFMRITGWIVRFELRKLSGLRHRWASEGIEKRAG